MVDDIKKLFEINVAEINYDIPLFPLNDVLLLPFGKLPLNIFEERYIKMALDALKANRLIGIVQPKNDNGVFYNTGCIGKITSFIETPDNRIVLNLDGISRFEILECKLENRGYYKAKISTQTFHEDINLVEPMINREELIKKYVNFFKMKKYELDFNILEETSNLQLITTLTMIAPFNKIDKQAILEAQNLLERIKIINSILDLNTFRVVGKQSTH